jgi:hypothetical protein
MTVTVMIAVLGGFLVLVGLWAVRGDRRNKRRIQQLASMLGAVSSGTGGEGVSDGIAYRFAYSSGSNRNPSALKVTIDSPTGQPFRVVREGRAERLSKRIGLSNEIQTGDPAFDDEFYIETEAVELTKTLLMHEEARDAVRAVFRLGFTAVRQHGQQLQAVWSPFKLRDDVDPSLITGAVAPLAAIARQMPATMPAVEQTVGISVGVVAAAIALMMALAGLAVAATRFRPLDGGAIMLDSLHYSIPALVPWLALAVLLLKGHSTARKLLPVLLITSVIAFVVGGNALETIVNGWADASPPSSHDEQVIRMYRIGGRTTTYHVVVTSWRRSRQSENLSVSYAEYRAARPHRHVTVVTKPGRLGFEWIVGYAVAGPPR